MRDTLHRAVASRLQWNLIPLSRHSAVLGMAAFGEALSMP